jgi:general L-amino acid transport system permease protein
MGSSSADFLKPFTRDIVAMKPAPVSQRGMIGWLRCNLFSDFSNTLLTIFMSLLILYFVRLLWDFFVTNATFTGQAREDCLPHHGACYPYLRANMGFFIYGFYSEAERWRVNLAAIIAGFSIIALLAPSLLPRKIAFVIFFAVFPIATFILLYGGILGLPVIEPYNWGGMIITFVVAITGIVLSLPLGILLALGRRSKLPLLHFSSVIFIELWRGVPLVTVLFMASIMLPLFLPASMTPDNLVRALAGVSLFSSAYIAEIVRGGLQSIPKVQYETAAGLGLGYWQSMRLIILPQALTKVIPSIVNSFLGLFKDTSLVFIVGLVDFLQAVDMSLVNPNWATPWTRYSGYAFAAGFYFVCCWAMSQYSVYMEKRLSAGN